MNLALSEKSQLLFNSPVSPSLRLSVIVPAKNESLDIISTLDALRLQADRQGNPIDHQLYEVLVLANNCSDDTYAICQNYQNRYLDFSLHVECIEIDKPIAHIGTVRRLLMDKAYRRLISVAGGKGIIVSTDADSQVDKNWICNILLEMENGVDVVGGRIIPKETPRLSRLHHLRDVTYRFFQTRLESEIDPCLSNPWPRHFQCYGPSLAVTCEIYEKAGRIPAIPFLEDEEFRKALKRIDAKIRHAPNVKIHTSSRLDGRVEFGFSVQLQHWSDMSENKQQQMVESLDTLIFKNNLKKRLRKVWNKHKQQVEASVELDEIARELNCSKVSLLGILRSTLYFETLWENIEMQMDKDGHQNIVIQPISTVIESFRHYYASKPKIPLPKVESLSMAPPETAFN
jgi:glycosyltransferase involved in cell wall biosynthesis